MSPSNRINAAVEDFLDRLKPGWSPPAYFAVYMAHLRSDPTWTEQEIWHIECQLRRLIVRLGRSAGGQWRVIEIPPLETILVRKRA